MSTATLFATPSIGGRPIQRLDTSQKRASILPHRSGGQDLWRVQAGLLPVADFEDIGDAQWLVDQLSSRALAVTTLRHRG